MFGAERRQAILDLIKVRGSASIADLARMVNVSEVTARRDVTALERRGELVRVHGGAMLLGLDDSMDSVALGGVDADTHTPMFGAQRRRLICSLVRANEAVSLAELSRTLNVSEMTVRRDLDILHRRGLVERARGGAMTTAAGGRALLGSSAWEVAREAHPAAISGLGAAPRAEALAAIASLAAGLGDEGGPIMLGAGSTVYALARRLLPTRPLTILTTSMPVARALAGTPNVDLVVASGALDGPSLSLVGTSAERWVARHRVARTFVSGTGLTPDRGLSSANLAAGDVDRAMAASGDEVIVLADQTKLGVETTYQVVASRDIDHLVTDGGSDGLVSAFRALGIRVHQPTDPTPRFPDPAFA